MPACPVCGEARHVHGWRAVAGMTLQRCLACGCAWFPPGRFSEDVVRAQYLTDTTSPTDYYRLTAAYDLETFGIRMARIVERTGFARGRVLDVGCNVGTFLEAAARAGWTPVGVEPNPAAAGLAAKRGFDVHRGFFDDALAGTLAGFDAVHLGDVIEHVPDPVAFLARARGVLRPEGVLVAVTPDLDSLLGRWLQIKPGEHLVYFTRRALLRAAATAGLREASVERWGRRRSVASMRRSTTFAARHRWLLRALDVPGLRAVVEGTLFHVFKDELLLTAAR